MKLEVELAATAACPNCGNVLGTETTSYETTRIPGKCPACESKIVGADLSLSILEVAE